MAIPQTPDCTDKAGDSSAATCWYEASQSLEQELDALFPQVLAAARHVDAAFQSTPRKEDRSAADDLMAAQKAWRAYRDADCKARADWAQGGSLEDVLISRCTFMETQRRIQLLREIEHDFKEP